jgi:sec-independent protein translocase protein TatA
MFSIWGLLLIVIVILLLFGGSKLPDLGRGMGKAIKEFKRSSSESEEIETKRKNRQDKP